MDSQSPPSNISTVETPSELQYNSPPKSSKKLIFGLGLVLFLLVIGVSIFLIIKLNKIPSTMLSSTNAKTISADEGCTLGPDYNYKVINNYPILISRRMESNKELIKFPPLPASEAEFLSMAKLTEDEAKSIVDGITIIFHDLIVPKPRKNSYKINKDQIESTRLTRLRSHFCNSSYPQGSIDSAVRVVWEIKMPSTSDNPSLIINKKFWYNWLIYVDAITGEIVTAVQSRYISIVNKPVPGWDSSFNLPKIGDEFIN